MSRSAGFLVRLGRHLRILLPLGLVVGLGVGYAFGDLRAGLVAGAALSPVLGLLFALRAD